MMSRSALDFKKKRRHTTWKHKRWFALILLANLIGASDFVFAGEFVGVFKPNIYADLSMKITGTVKSMNVRLGQKVMTGQTLATLDCKVYEIELRRARIVYQASQQKFQISKKLSKLQGISQEDLILDELELASALADLDLATNAVSRCELQAPFDGYISKIHVEKFSVAEAQRPFISLVDPSSGWVDFVASTADNIAVQDPVTLVLDNGHTILARVTSSSPVIDPVSQTRDFRVRLDPTPENIFPGIVLMVESAN